MTRHTLLILGIAVAIAASLPASAQTLRVGGDSVEIVRDAYGVPHIYAGTPRGLFFGSGYAIAEDRLAQMDLNRRAARGEMAALVGPGVLAADRETRTDGYTEPERESHLAQLGPELRVMFDAYAEGVNRYIADALASGVRIQPANYPAPFRLEALRPWRATDSVAIGQMMARRFGGGEGGELRNMLLLSLLKTLHRDRAWRMFNDLAWRNDPTAPTTIHPGEDGLAVNSRPFWSDSAGKPLAGAGANLPTRFDREAARRGADAMDQTARLDAARRYGTMTKWGSYCFVVSGRRSATGNALLVGGPQMGFRTPQIAHEIHLVGAGIDAIGMGFPGVPGVLIGANPSVAWSTTTGVGDQTDVFVETLDPADQTRYRFRGAWRTMERRTETIDVAGGAPVRVELFRTLHGPVVQWDRSHNLAYTRSAAYWNHELTTFQAVARFMTARNLKEFAAGCAMVSTSHNWLCATRDGEIGYWYTGLMPIRASGIDPRLPTPGDGSKEWRGFLPFASMPHLTNPLRGFIANWNNKPAVWWDNRDTPVWGEVFHNARIDELLAAKPRISPEDMRNVLLDIGTNDYNAQVFLPLVRGAIRSEARFLSPLARRAGGYLMAWDHHATEGSVAKTIFDEWLQQVREELFAKPFGFIRAQVGDLFNVAMQPSLIAHVLRGKSSPVPAQTDYLGGRTPARVMALALNAAVMRLAASRGADPAGWRYTRGRIDFRPQAPIPSTDRGTYIQIVECARAGARGVNILPPGQSERLDSPHFGDQRDLAGWFQFKPMPVTLDEIRRGR